MRPLFVALIVAAGVLLTAAYGAFFSVREDEQAIVLQFGDPLRILQEPGLYLKVPFLQNVAYYDKKVLDYDHPDEEVIASDKKRIVLDTFARYRIVDPLEFRRTVRSEREIVRRLNPIMNAALRNAVGSSTVNSLLSDERAALMRNIRDRVNQRSSQFGIEVLDVRIRRADLPLANSQAIYERMKSERTREAKEFRAQGAEAAQRIRSRADRDRTVIIAEARRQSQGLRGDGDAESIKVYASAFNKDPDFFHFYRSMEAYRQALANDATTMVLSPQSDFFRFFADRRGVRRGDQR